MRTILASLLLAIPLPFCVASGCGAKVVIEDGAGGDTPSGSTSATASTPEGPLGEACADACRKVEPCLEDPSSCMDGCLSVSSACQKPYITFLECVTATFVAGCHTSAVCSGELASYTKCTGSCLQYPPSCEGCDCTQPACDPNQSFGYRCTPLEGSIECECFRNGETVGSCTSFGGECSGPIGSSCCGALIFTPAPEG